MRERVRNRKCYPNMPEVAVAWFAVLLTRVVLNLLISTALVVKREKEMRERERARERARERELKRYESEESERDREGEKRERE